MSGKKQWRRTVSMAPQYHYLLADLAAKRGVPKTVVIEKMLDWAAQRLGLEKLTSHEAKDRMRRELDEKKLEKERRRCLPPGDTLAAEGSS